VETAAEERLASVLAAVLLVGLLGSTACMVAGIALGVITGQGARHVVPLDQVLPSLMHGQVQTLLDVGILLLFATPLAGVVTALVLLARARDTFFASVAALLLIVLASGFAVALR
jgi:uncharacterized membrane protein